MAHIGLPVFALHYVPSRSLQRILIRTFIARLRAAQFGAAAFAFRCTSNKNWRAES